MGLERGSFKFKHVQNFHHQFLTHFDVFLQVIFEIILCQPYNINCKGGTSFFYMEIYLFKHKIGRITQFML